MSLEVNTHEGTFLKWNADKLGHNAFTIKMRKASDGTAYDITPWTLVLYIFAAGFPDSPVLTLTEESGITNGGANGDIDLILTKDQSSIKLSRGEYNYRLDRTVDDLSYNLFYGPLIPRTKSSGSGSTATATVNLSGTTVSVSVTLTGLNASNDAVALTDGETIALTAIRHTLTSDEAAITFTITYTGDYISIELILNAASATWTFPTGSLCVSEGVSSGDNTLSLSGTSGDKYSIGIMKFGSAYTVGAKNLNR